MTERTDRNIWAATTYDDAHAARRWLAALGFTDGICVPGDKPDEIMHSEMLWPEGGRVMVASRGKEDGTFAVPTGGAALYVVTADPDAVYARAKELGATMVREMEETDYGSKGFSIADEEGNSWSFGTYAG